MDSLSQKGASGKVSQRGFRMEPDKRNGIGCWDGDPRRASQGLKMWDMARTGLE